MTARTKWMDSLAGPRNRALLLTIGVILTWAHAAWFVLQKKGGFLDDAYIYFHLANNVLETGTARFYPLAESLALLASSPLRQLLFWLLLILARFPGSTWQEKPGQLGVLLGLLFLTRPEYGLPALVFGAVWALRTWDDRQILSGARGLLAVATGWDQNKRLSN